ncbi:MAG: HEAT repeat domain-containing protein [Planctomycetota bacterium]
MTGSPDDMERLARALESDAIPVRMRAKERLAAFGLQALPAVRVALHSPVPCARRAAAALAGALGNVEAARELVPLLDDPKPSVRRSAALALAQSPTETALPLLAPLLASRRSRLRRAALHAVGRLGGAAWGIVEDAAASPSPEARESAARIALAVGGERARSLLETATRDSKGRVRRTAHWALRRLARRS